MTMLVWPAAARLAVGAELTVMLPAKLGVSYNRMPLRSGVW